MASTFSESADDFPPLRGYRNELLYSVERLARASPVSKGNSADSKCDRYLLIETGWHDGDRIYGTLLHIDIIDGKL